MSFQKIEILGVIGKNAEVKTINQKQYLSFSVAIDNGKDAQGNKRPSDWFDVLYSYNAQTQQWLLQRLLAKSLVYVSGRARSGAYIDKEGKAVPTLGVFANQVEPIGMVQRNDQQMQGGYVQQNGYVQQQAPQGYPPQGGYAPQMPPQGQMPPSGGYAPQMPPQGQMPPQQAPQGYAPQQAQMPPQQASQDPFGVQGDPNPNLPF